MPHHARPHRTLLGLLALAACAGDDGAHGTSAGSDGSADATTQATTGATSSDTTAGPASTSSDATQGPVTTAAPVTTTAMTTTLEPTRGAETTASATTEASTTGGGDDYGCQGAPVFENDFDDDAVGVYSDLDDWNTPPWDNGVGEGRVEIIDGDAAYSGRSLRVHYPAGGVGPGEGGAQWRLELDDARDELYLAYRLRFGDGFDFVLGGKLPGLVGGTAPTGCVQDDGGFSARSMWRVDGHGVQYMYFPEKLSSCDDDFDYALAGEPALFQAGVWHTLEHRLVMNTPGEADGVLQAWLDGQLVLDVQDFRYRLQDGAYAIDAMYFSTFFGGSGPEWGPTADEVIDFDDFVLCDGPITH